MAGLESGNGEKEVGGLEPQDRDGGGRKTTPSLIWLVQNARKVMVVGTKSQEPRVSLSLEKGRVSPCHKLLKSWQVITKPQELTSLWPGETRLQ